MPATFTRENALLLAAVPALLCACGSTGLGRVPVSLVELYDMSDPAGSIEIELERDGTIREMEADVAVETLPRSVREVALARLPGARITGGERELQQDGERWEVKLIHEGAAWEFIVDEGGRVVESEQEIERSEAPPEVLAAAEASVPGGDFKSVEVIHRGNTIEYHVKKSRGGASYKVVLSPDGRVLRAVREARAEIEIPLD